MERNSIGMMVGGIVLTAGGVVALSMGALVYIAATSIQCDCIGPGACDCSDEKGEVGGIALMAGGVLGLGVGIPLIVLGARKVPAEPETAVLIGPGAAGLRCRF
jgi:hypothetical protein